VKSNSKLRVASLNQSSESVFRKGRAPSRRGPVCGDDKLGTTNDLDRLVSIEFGQNVGNKERLRHDVVLVDVDGLDHHSVDELGQKVLMSWLSESEVGKGSKHLDAEIVKVGGSLVESRSHLADVLLVDIVHVGNLDFGESGLDVLDVVDNVVSIHLLSSEVLPSLGLALAVLKLLVSRSIRLVSNDVGKLLANELFGFGLSHLGILDSSQALQGHRDLHESIDGSEESLESQRSPFADLALESLSLGGVVDPSLLALLFLIGLNSLENVLLHSFDPVLGLLALAFLRLEVDPFIGFPVMRC